MPLFAKVKLIFVDKTLRHPKSRATPPDPQPCVNYLMFWSRSANHKLTKVSGKTPCIRACVSTFS